MTELAPVDYLIVAPAEPDYAAELAQLKAQEILTEDEFQAKKKQILWI